MREWLLILDPDFSYKFYKDALDKFIKFAEIQTGEDFNDQQFLSWLLNENIRVRSKLPIQYWIDIKQLQRPSKIVTKDYWLLPAMALLKPVANL